MVLRYNQFGQEDVDFNEETASSRVGSRIRKIRKALSLSQTDLGARVGLSADRIQKYENGARKPKLPMLKDIAGALGVEAAALTDPIVTNYTGAMYAFFEMEDIYDLRVEAKTTDYGYVKEMCIVFPDTEHNNIRDYLLEWYREKEYIKEKKEKAESSEEMKEIEKEYNLWKWTFPLSIIDRTSREMKKDRLKQRIAELQQELDELEQES